MKYRPVLVVFLFIGICLGSCRTLRKSAVIAHKPLRDTQWNAVFINGMPVSGDIAIQPFIVFEDSEKCHGNLGCNDFFGIYDIRRNRIRLSYIGSTKKLCQDMDVERAFVRALKGGIDSYAFEQGELILYVARKEVLRFEAGAGDED